jgi:DNA invertase Pin-like site-specific DNA recombinase
MGRKFGYARVSTRDQCLELQKKKLIEAGVEAHRILTDKASGKDNEREGLKLLLLKVEKGDELIVTKLDRLGRNTLEMCRLLEEFNNMGVSVRFLEDGLDTNGPMGKLLITLVSAVAEAERARIMERTNEGRIDAQMRGVKFGRKPSVNKDKVKELWNDGWTAIKIAKEMKIGRSTVYKVIDEEKKISPMETQEIGT